jgi:hypothetical protein
VTIVEKLALRATLRRIGSTCSAFSILLCSGSADAGYELDLADTMCGRDLHWKPVAMRESVGEKSFYAWGQLTRGALPQYGVLACGVYLTSRPKRESGEGLTQIRNCPAAVIGNDRCHSTGFVHKQIREAMPSRTR